MRKRYKIGLFILVALIIAELILLTALFLRGSSVPVLDPKGIVGLKERNLMIFTVLLGLVVILPVFAMTIFIAWKYRESNTSVKKKYTPDWDTNRLAEVIWWGIPIIIISILATVVWISTHSMDPYKKLDPGKPKITIQVVALDWKWLFIYPDQNIATINFVQFPKDVQVDFEVTADAPMNSFWIPQLGGQMYAMPGMVNHQYLSASHNGDYDGSSANISGKGFAGMKFIARASSQTDFDKWVSSVKHDPKTLTSTAYADLLNKSSNNPVTYYSSVENSLYDTIVMKFMAPVEGRDNKQAQTEISQPTPDMKNMNMNMGTN